MLNKKIHFIGICGVAMSALALAFKKIGSDASVGVNWKVTGSDVGFYPPISTHLKNAGIDFYSGWHPDQMVADGIPDLVVVGNVAGSNNPEWLYTQEHKLNYKSYPEVIAEYFVKKNSIVCAGTYGKSTSTALLTWILKEAGFDPSYMFGGLSLNEITLGSSPTPTQQRLPQRAGSRSRDKRGIAMPSAEMTNSDWSVLEGDEYKSSRWDNGPKFAHYSPTHLLLTSIVWDHADVYPTEKKYIQTFQKLVDSIPKNGLIVASENIKILQYYNIKKLTYGKNPSNDYAYTNITQSKSGIDFTITKKISNTKYQISSTCLGEYMADNITGCFALAASIGIPEAKIISAIKSFPGMKRRLEKRYEEKITVFDDIAHSPVKAKPILETLKHIYQGKIFAVFEPNTGNRRPEAAPWYDHAFDAADEVIIPRLTKIKSDANETRKPFEGDDLARIISATHGDTRYIDDDEELLNYLQKKIQPDDVVVFLGSHGFRGMIETLVYKVQKL